MHKSNQNLQNSIPNPSQMDQHGAKRIPKGSQKRPNGAKGTNIYFVFRKRALKGDENAPQNRYPEKVRPGKAPGQKSRSFGSPFCRFMLKEGGFWEPFGFQKQLKLMKKTRQKSIPKKYRKMMPT